MTLPTPLRLPLILSALPLLALTACHKAAPEPDSTPTPEAPATRPTSAKAAAGHPTRPLHVHNLHKLDPRWVKALPHSKTQASQQAPPVAEVPVSPDDPLHGKFTLADATKGLRGKGQLVAGIVTGKGKLTCRLYDQRAPITVANFIGLARGIRPWKDPGGKWVKKPAYDGTTFHRVIKGFMIQGGDAAGNGTGEPGYVIPDEIWKGATHNREGQLCMANRGPNTNGAQFFIMDGKATHLDGGYTIFGMCKPDKVIDAIAGVPVHGDRAVTPPEIKRVVIHRGRP